MRVLEGSSGNIPAMGKKKHKLRKKSRDLELIGSDSSDEPNIQIGASVSESSCPHLLKAVNFNVMKKYLKQEDAIGVCSSCAKNNTEIQNNQSSSLENSSNESKSNQVDSQIWICLQCGHQGCGRYSPEKHAIVHFLTPRSSSHSLVLNIHSWIVWCYDCDKEIDASESRRLNECVEYLKKQNSSYAVNTAINQECEVITKAMIDNDKLCNSRETKSFDNCKPKPSQSCSSLPKLKGLNNLGNTCFLNAVLQNLSQTHLLETLLNEKGKNDTVVKIPHRRGSKDSIYNICSKDDNTKYNLDPIPVHLCESGPLTQSLSGFIHEMTSTAKNGTISPNKLFGQVCKKAPKFKGFQQQDSHELLRHLLDGINAEEIKRVQSGILKVFQLPTNVNPNKVDEDLKNKIKDYWKYAKRTYIDSIFGGYFLSSVVCEDCHKPSQIIEPFQDISLPITEEKPTRPGNSWNFKKKDNKDDSGSLNKDKKSDNFLSKHLLIKSKKAARKEAKKLLKDKNTSHANKEMPVGDNSDTSSFDVKTAASESTNSISDRNEDFCQNEEEEHSKSDGDIEDNAESDVSKLGDLESRRLNKTDENSLKRCNSSLNCKDINDNDVKDDLSLVDDIVIKLNSLNLQKDNESSQNEMLTSDYSMLTENSSVSSFKSSYLTDSNSDLRINDMELNSRLSKLDRVKILAMNSLVPRNQPIEHECSLQTCLNQFTSAELLTGNNKFGCENCTRDKYGSQSSLEDKKEIVYSNASKQVLIFKPPAVLTLHLKRFQQVGFSLRKVNRRVAFPLLLDVAPYCSTLCDDVKQGKKKIIYSLYGVVEHSGKLCGGHYTAYVKVRQSQSSAKEFLQHSPILTENLNSILKALYDQKLSFIDEDEESIANSNTEQAKPGKWYYVSDSRVTESSESAVLKCQAYILFYERIC